jgi:DNA-directed RNA polymerase sigma subunit (sigma70/sigma32)
MTKKTYVPKREDASLTVVAEELGITRSRVGQIQADVLEKLKKALARKGITDGDLPSRESYWDRL